MMQSVSELFSEKKVKVWLENLPQPVERFTHLDVKEIFSSYNFGAASLDKETAVQNRKTFTKRYVADFHVTMEHLVDEMFIRDTNKEEFEKYLRKEMQARTIHYLYGDIRNELMELTYEVMRLESYGMSDPYNGPSARLKNIIQKISL